MSVDLGPMHHLTSVRETPFAKKCSPEETSRPLAGEGIQRPIVNALRMTKPLPDSYLFSAPACTAESAIVKSGKLGTGNHRETKAAIAAAYDEHHEKVYRLALRYGAGNNAWAEDITQEVFLQLIRYADELSDLDSLGGWLYRTTTNRCLNRLRKERFLVWITFDWLNSAKEAPTMDGVMLAEAREDLRRALESLHRLPAKEQVAFAMHHLDGKTLEEIGDVLGFSKGYVSKLLARATSRHAEEGWRVGE